MVFSWFRPVLSQVAQHRKIEARILEMLQVGRRWQERARNNRHHWPSGLWRCGVLDAIWEGGNRKLGQNWHLGWGAGAGVRLHINLEQGSQNRRVCRCWARWAKKCNRITWLGKDSGAPPGTGRVRYHWNQPPGPEQPTRSVRGEWANKSCNLHMIDYSAQIKKGVSKEF